MYGSLLACISVMRRVLLFDMGVFFFIDMPRCCLISVVLQLFTFKSSEFRN